MKLIRTALFFLVSLCACSLPAHAQSVEELKARLTDPRYADEHSKIHSDIGTVYYNSGEFTTALDHFFKALAAAEKKNDRYNIATAHQAIGSVYMETEKFSEAVKYLEKAEQAFTEQNEQKSLGRTLITLGNVYYMQIKDSLSEHYYRRAMQQFQGINDSVGLMDAYKNLGAVYFEKGSRKDTLKALELIKASLKYVRKSDTLNQFQSNLSMAEIYVYSGNLAGAKTYLDICRRLLPNIRSLHILDDYYYCLHDYHKRSGNFEQALTDYKLYKIFQDSILNTENNKQLAELNIKYKTAQKEKQITLLNAEKARQRLTLTIVVLLALISAALSFFLFARYRKKQQAKKEQEMLKQKEMERMRIARDMHDEIGAGLTRILMRSEQVRLHLQTGKEIKNGILESLEKMGSESRELSHNIGEIIWALNPGNDKLDNLFAYIRSYAYDYLEETDIKCRINFPEHIPDISVAPELRRNIFLIVKESLNNIVKHACATEVKITLTLFHNHFSIDIVDNGKGMTHIGSQENGNGLRNMEKRAIECGGNFIVESAKGKGIAISLENIPLKNPTKVG